MWLDGARRRKRKRTGVRFSAPVWMGVCSRTKAITGAGTSPTFATSSSSYGVGAFSGAKERFATTSGLRGDDEVAHNKRILASMGRMLPRGPLPALDDDKLFAHYRDATLRSYGGRIPPGF